MATVTPDGQFMDMDTAAVQPVMQELTRVATQFTTEITALIDEADAIEGTIGRGPMGRDFAAQMRQPLYDIQKLALRLGVLADERARSLNTVHGHYVAAADASTQAFGSA